MKQAFSKMLLLSAVILTDMLAGMELDLFVPGFVELQNSFNLTPFLVESLLSVNFLGYCLSLFFVGELADYYGRKPIILVGLMIFIVGSVLCLMAPFYSFLLVGRFMQGLGIAAPAILSFLIIADLYPLKKQQSLFAILNGIMNASVGVAPVIGSYITLYFHWQGNFAALLILGILAFFMALFFVPLYPQTKPKENFPGEGYFNILRSEPLRLGITHFILQFTPYWVFVGMSPLLYMGALGVSLKHFGYYQGALAFVFAIGSLLFGMVVARYDQLKMLKISGYMFVFGFMSLGTVSFLDSFDPIVITLAFLVFVIASIAPSAILYPILLEVMPRAKGRIAALMQGGRLLFAALSLQVAGYFYQDSFRNVGMIIMVFIALSTMTLFTIVNRGGETETGKNIL
ncbi:MAG: multidrug effflux MFS transporter [Alphaproteobacteria bacterium]|nr:multidrug effflux MFS transporter [Alphaproteobacteria bacterium]NCQ66497.1 multidrug effflux MFS transporter [Alphaproteobacteria bacterium]NCT08288.1 multidrug effflux MFS transporter [Alphaproteobacteria bacterium]